MCWYVTVQFTDDPVDGFLPGMVPILPQTNGHVKLLQCYLRNLQKPVRHLSTDTCVNTVNDKQIHKRILYFH